MVRRQGWLVRVLGMLGVETCGAVFIAAARSGPLFLVEPQRTPRVAISWTTTDGETLRLEGDRPYRASKEHTFLGRNISAYVAVGGTRVDKGVSDPAALTVRAGFYKVAIDRPFFDDIAPGSTITVEIHNIAYNLDAVQQEDRVLQHLQYSPDQAKECGLGDAALDQFNTADTADDLQGRVTMDNGRLGILTSHALDGKETGQAAGEEKHGSIELRKAEDGTHTLIAQVPYPLFRHVKDPWQRDEPGTFLEPMHFHIEFEALPAEVAAARETSPLPPPARSGNPKDWN